MQANRPSAPHYSSQASPRWPWRPARPEARPAQQAKEGRKKKKQEQGVVTDCHNLPCKTRQDSPSNTTPPQNPSPHLFDSFVTLPHLLSACLPFTCPKINKTLPILPLHLLQSNLSNLLTLPTPSSACCHLHFHLHQTTHVLSLNPDTNTSSSPQWLPPILPTVPWIP